MKSVARALFALVLAALLSAPAHATTANLVLEAGDEVMQGVKLMDYMSYLEDPQGALRVNDVVAGARASAFAPANQSSHRLDFGVTTSAVWLRLTLHNHSDRRIVRMVSFPLSHTDRVELHRPHAQKETAPLITGLTTPLQDRPFEHWQPILPVVLEPGATETVYLRALSRQRLVLQSELWDEQSLDAALQTYTSSIYFLNGWMATLLVFHLLLFMKLRETVYGYYVAYGVAMLLAQGLYNGSLHEFVPGERGSFVVQALALAQTAGAIFGLQFARKCLALDKYLPRWDRWSQGVAWVTAVVVPVHVIATGRYSYLVLGMAVLAFCTVIVVEAYAVVRKVPFARPVFVSWLPTIPLFGWMALAQVKLLPQPDYPPVVFSLGVAAELTLLTRAVLLRFISVQRANRLARTQALQASEARLQAMRDADRELEERVQQRSHELEQTQAQLQAARLQAEQANQAKQNFLSNMSHEIRTPLNAMLGMGYLATEYPMEPQARNYLGKSSAAAQSLLGLVNDILEASRLDAGKMEIESIAYSLHKVLQEVVDEHTGPAREKGLTLQLQVDHELPDALLGDAQKLHQMADKLLSNAVKFTREGSVRVIAQRATRADGSLALSLQVTDTGKGMKPEELAQVFAPFAQADSSLTRHHTGVGLGLRIAHGLAELLGGGLTASSVPGQGSTFKLTVPVAEQRSDSAAGGVLAGSRA